MIWKKRDLETPGGEADRTIRRILEAAADTEPRREAPPFFAARVRARAALETREGERARHPIGVAALQMLPALAVAVLGLGAWSGYESYAAAAEARSVVARALESPVALDEAVLVALLFDPAAGEEGR